MFKVQALLYALAGSSLLAAAYDDISVKWPCPRYSPNGIDCPELPAGQQLDSDIGAPIGIVESQKSAPLCKHSTPWAGNSAVINVNEPMVVQFNAPPNFPGGGHCEFSVSYDNGQSFVVIAQELDSCFLNSTSGQLLSSYTLDLPRALPSSKHAIFAWTYATSHDERLLYMNCADVEIQGSQASTFTGKEMTLVNYHNYPQMPLSNGNNQAGREYFTTDARIITVLANKDDDHTTTQLPHQELRRRHYKTVVETETEKEMATVTASAPAAAATQDASNNVTGQNTNSINIVLPSNFGSSGTNNVINNNNDNNNSNSNSNSNNNNNNNSNSSNNNNNNDDNNSSNNYNNDYNSNEGSSRNYGSHHGGYRHKSHKHKSHRKGSKKGGKCQSCCSCSCGNANANYMPPMYGNSYGYGYYGFQDTQGSTYPQMQQNFNGYSESSQFSYPDGGQNGYYGSNQDGFYGGGQDNYSGGSQYFESGQGGFGDSNQGKQYGGSQSNGQSGYANGYSYYESYGSGDSQNFDQGFNDKAMKMDYVGPIQDDSVDSLFGRAVKESDSK